MERMKHLLEPLISTIENPENEMATLAFIVYEILLITLEDIIDMKNWSSKSKLAIIGGITINCDEEEPDMFLPIMFEVRTKNSKNDLFKESFTVIEIEGQKEPLHGGRRALSEAMVVPQENISGQRRLLSQKQGNEANSERSMVNIHV